MLARRVSRQGLRLAAGVLVAAGVLALGWAPAQARAAGATSTCDPALELCLLTDAPWVSPQAIRYKGPASANSLEVKLRQGSKRIDADAIEVIDQDATTKTWRAIIPAKLPERDLTVRATTQGPALQSVASGAVSQVVSSKRLKIRKRGGRRLVNLRFDADGPVQAVLKVKLTGRYPAEETKTIKSWKVKKELPNPGSKLVKLRTGNVERLCKRYGSCRVRASAQLKSLGYKVGRKGKSSKVPTPPERFGGSLDFVPGNTSSGDGGRRYNYAVYVERGIKIDRKLFAKDVGKTLGDRRGWTRTGRVSFRQVSSASSANTRVILASPATVDRLCAPLQTEGYVSCTQGSSIVLNLNRWRYAVPHFDSRLTYRRMLVNHEMGHRIGHGHRNCSGRGRKAPVMQQQTYGLQGCRANPWPLDSEAASARVQRSNRSLAPVGFAD